MAIKGKKPKARSGRVVTAGPRPAYVPPKVPLMQRTGAKFLVALVAETIFFALLVGFGEQSKADRERAAIVEFTTLIDASLARAGEAVQLRAAEAVVLPELLSLVGGLAAGDPPSPDATERAETWSDSLTKAADGVLSASADFEQLDLDQRRVLGEARDQIDHGLRIFAGLAEQLVVAASIEGQPREDLAAAIQDQILPASQTFEMGYRKLQDLRLEMGLQPAIPPAPPGLPGELPPGFDPTMPGGGTQVVPAEPPGGQGGGQGGGGEGGNG